MQGHALDPGSRPLDGQPGSVGGLAVAAGRPADPRAAGCDTVLVETVGVGQSEMAVAATVDCILVLLAPGARGRRPAREGGHLEVGDVLVVTKADREGAIAGP